MKRLSMIATGLLALPLFLACQDGPTGPPPPDDPPGQPVTSLEIIPESFTVKVGGTFQPRALTINSEGVAANAGHLVKWSSSNPGVAAISARGRVRGMAGGNALITALYNGKRAQASVRVVDAGDGEDNPKPER